MKMLGFGKAILSLALVSAASATALAGPVDDFTIATNGGAPLSSPTSSGSTVSNTYYGNGSISPTSPAGSAGYDTTLGNSHILGAYRTAILSNNGTNSSTTVSISAGNASFTTSVNTTANNAAANFITLKYDGSSVSGGVVTTPAGGLNTNALAGHAGLKIGVVSNNNDNPVLATLTLTDTSGNVESESVPVGLAGSTLTFAFANLSSTPGFNIGSIKSIQFNFGFSGEDTFSLGVNGGGGLIPFDNPPTPEPATLATFGLLTLVGGVVARRKLKVAPVA